MAENFLVTAEQHGKRLDKFLSTQQPALSRSFLQSLITSGSIRVNDAPRKPNYTVRAGDRITLEIPPPRVSVGAARSHAARYFVRGRRAPRHQ
jgi:ribosomal 50S subunit-recycling heat shock protein